MLLASHPHVARDTDCSFWQDHRYKWMILIVQNLTAQGKPCLCFTLDRVFSSWTYRCLAMLRAYTRMPRAALAVTFGRTVLYKWILIYKSYCSPLRKNGVQSVAGRWLHVHVPWALEIKPTNYTLYTRILTQPNKGLGTSTNQLICLLVDHSTLKLLQFAVYFIKFGWAWSEILRILSVKNVGLNTIQWTICQDF
jgi:hypothetical protein